MKLQNRIASAIATGAILLNIATPAFADTTIEILGNGQNSSNNANVNMTQSQTVVQTNVANVSNNVDSDAKTGGNNANGNNGGAVTVVSGNATSNVTVANDLNTNAAQLNCCANAGNTTVVIGGTDNTTANAQNSTNTVNLDSTSNNTVLQLNTAYVANNVDSDAKTGGNDANGNNGGSVTVVSGNASSNVNVTTEANRNFARIGGAGLGGNSSGDLSLKILGNAQNSTNNINLDLDKSNVIDQFNTAYVYNYVDSDAFTGWNDANGNNGGTVLVKSGNANATANVLNDVNFNWAASDCGCLLGDVTVKVAHNAQDSYNKIWADLSTNDSLAFQTNVADLYNNLDDVKAKTGGNDANGNNAGGANGDPVVVSGDANAKGNATNSGNVNIFGGPVPTHLPIVGDGGGSISFTFDLGSLFSWSWLGSH